MKNLKCLVLFERKGNNKYNKIYVEKYKPGAILIVMENKLIYVEEKFLILLFSSLITTYEKFSITVYWRKILNSFLLVSFFKSQYMLIVCLV